MTDKDKPNWEQLPESELEKAARYVLIALELYRSDVAMTGTETGKEIDEYALANIQACGTLLLDLIRAMEG